jgi:hypothetical protein
MAIRAASAFWIETNPSLSPWPGPRDALIEHEKPIARRF